MAEVISDAPVLRPGSEALHSAHVTKAAEQNSEPKQKEIVEGPTSGRHLQPRGDAGTVIVTHQVGWR
jgi:hypothetical protein